ncbi:MAG TPA: c-type cytochrome [Solirubrobacterales bacterium]|nr:c-type cytochrome [Solirubrobacterales bacterium]
MAESLFYIAGGALIAVTLILSLFGMRSDRFPSGNVLAVGIAVVFLLVAATAVGAVELAQHEEGERLEEANVEADAAEAEETAEGEEAGAAPAPTPDEKGGTGAGSGLDGAQVFVSVGCGSCHTVAELGSDATGTIGPNLDSALAGKDDAFIEESIVDPSAVVAKGFPDGTMPANYGTELSPEEIDALVAFLSKTAGN